MGIVSRFVNGISVTLNVFGTLLIVALMLLICADVFGRALFSAPVSGVPEMVSLSIVAIVFLQASEAFRQGRFTRSEAILNYFEKISPRLRAFAEMLFSIAGLVVVGALLHASLPLFEKAWNRNTFVGTVGDFIAPVWPVKLILLIGCSILFAQMLLMALRQLMIVLGGSARPKTDFEGGDHDAI